MMRLAALLLIAALEASAASLGADSARGAKLFETLSCVACHSVNGHGGKAAPDLGRITDRNFTPSTVASTMWNHAPAMWASMRERDIRAGDLNEQAAADLFAFFYSARFFEKPGDAGRGKRIFAAKHCAECHGLTTPKIPEAKPVAEWTATGHPMELVNAMWNHAATMRQEFTKRRLAFPEITAQELSDILVYVRNLPTAKNATTQLEISSGENGKALFDSKGCSTCHTGKLALPARLKGMTLTDIAVAMWNHAPRMTSGNAPANPPRLAVAEMRDITSFLWAEQFFQDAGDPGAGRRVFVAKKCTVCHEGASNKAKEGAPKITGGARTFSGASMVSALWHHGPRMLDQMKSQNVAWPRFDARDMSNLIAYLNQGSKP
jgi:cytochrome c2